MQLSDFITNGGTSTNAVTIFSDVVPTEDVKQGDVLSILASGQTLYAVPETDPAGPYRKPFITADLTSFNSLRSTIASTNIAGAMEQLTNSNVVVPMIQAGTNYPQFTVYDQESNVVVGPTTIEANAIVADTGGSGLRTIRCRPLAGGGFVVAYLTAAGMRTAIYSNAGVVVTAAATVTANCHRVCKIQPLSGGGYALLWMYSSAGWNIYTQAFSAVGAALGAAALIETLAAAETFLAGTWGAGACQWNTTGYAVSYDYTTGAGANHFYRLAFFSSLGVQVGASVGLAGGASTGNQKVFGTADGGVVIAWLTTTAGSNKYAKYSSAGAVVSAAAQIVATAISALAGIAFDGTGKFMLTWASNTTTNAFSQVYSAAGVGGGVNDYTGGSSSVVASPNMDVCAMADGTWCIVTIPTAAAGSLLVINVNAAATAPYLFAGTGGATLSAASNVLAKVLPSSVAACGGGIQCLAQTNLTTGNTLQFRSTLVKARSPVGAAVAASPAATPVRSIVYGPAALRPDVTWVPVSYDATSGGDVHGAKVWMAEQAAYFQGF